MLDLNTTKIGSRVTVNIVGLAPMKKRGNPLFGCVMRNHLISGNVAGPESYANKLAKTGEEPTGAGSWFIEACARRPWLLRNAKKLDGKLYVRVVSPSVIRREYLVNGELATPAQLRIIRAFKKASSGVFHTYDVENCANVE